MVFSLVAAAPAAATSPESLLPVNDRVREMTLAYCLTGDAEGVGQLLSKRLLVTGRLGIGESFDLAANWIAGGFCADYLRAAEAAMPGVTLEAASALWREGFGTAVPISEQASGGRAGYFGTLDRAFAAIGKVLGQGYRHAGHGRSICIAEGPAPICDDSWIVRQNAGGQRFAPSAGLLGA